jgi:hypothetical protein
LNTKDLIQKVSRDGKSHESPSGRVIASPMSCISSGTHTVASTDDERPSMFFEEIKSWDCGGMAVVRMDLPVSQGIFLIKSTVMFKVDIDGHLVD